MEAADGRSPEEPDAIKPTWIGPYRVLEELGSGGMGTVYLVERRTDVTFRAALKVVRPGLARRDVLARFELERQSLALMDHEHIARIHDAGTSADGLLYFVMEYVPGLPITRYCDERRLDIRQRLALFAQLIDAVQHAHQKGVIHRDLKPGNILVREEDDRPVLKVIDFGLARAVHGPLMRGTLFTEAGMIVGTPEYMSPEQADPSRDDVDTRSDVYALGVILYELLVGALPFSRGELLAAGELEMRRRIREDLPPTPSSRISRDGSSEIVARARGTTSQRLRRLVSQDLDWIAMKSLHKDRRRRYATAQGLGEDIARYLADEPILARPDNVGYRLHRWARRHRVGLSMGVAVGTTAALALWYWVDGLRLGLQLATERSLAADPLRLDALLREAQALPHSLPADRSDLLGWLRRADELALTRAQHERRRDRLRAEAEGAVGAAADDAFLASLAAVSANGAVRGEVAASLEKIDAVTAAMSGLGPSWRATCAAIAADPRYACRRFASLEGFAPLGADPRSGLQEFAYLPSGVVPQRRPDGSLETPDGVALVFVLVPGGMFMMGACEGDQLSQRAELPRHELRVASFLLSKYELTEMQWMELSAQANPPSKATGDTWLKSWRDLYAEGSPERVAAVAALARLPVESVSWYEIDALLRRSHLRLPTEAEWEYAARAGSTGIWSFGDDPQALPQHANLADRSAQSLSMWFAQFNVNVAWNDGYPLAAPVGAFAANAFGLHDMIGNVAEWCSSAMAPYATDVEYRVDPDERAVRGGGFRSDRVSARTSARQAVPIGNRTFDVGARPACDVVGAEWR